MAETERIPFDRRLRVFVRAQRFFLSLVVLGIGILLTVLAVVDLTPLNQTSAFHGINGLTDQSGSGGPNYDLAFVIMGPIIAIIGAYLVAAYYLSRRKFEHLMLSKSKAEFLRNLPDIEDLLWDLTPKDEVRYEQRKSELRIRR
jgi:hypothetical protein